MKTTTALQATIQFVYPDLKIVKATCYKSAILILRNQVVAELNVGFVITLKEIMLILSVKNNQQISLN